MDAAHGSAGEDGVGGGVGVPINSQQPSPFPLSQLASKTTLPGVSQLCRSGFLPHDAYSQGGLPRLSPLPAPPPGGGYLGLPLTSLGSPSPLPPAPWSQLPPLSFSQANDCDSLGLAGGLPAHVSEVPEVGVPAALPVVELSPAHRGADAVAGARLPALSQPATGLDDAGWAPGGGASFSPTPAATFYPASLGSPSYGSPTLPSPACSPSSTPLTLSTAPDALAAGSSELPPPHALASEAVISPTKARRDPGCIQSTRSREDPTGGTQAPPPCTPQADTNAVLSPAPSLAALPRPGTTSSPRNFPTPQTSSSPPPTQPADSDAAPSPTSSPAALSEPGSTTSLPSTPALASSPPVRRAVPAAATSALSSVASQPASITPPSSKPATGTQQVVPVALGAGGIGLLQAIATLARQLVDGHRGPVKLTVFYAVLQAGNQDGRTKSIIVDCYGPKKTVEEQDLIMAEWGQRRAAPTGAPGGPAPLKKPPVKPNDNLDANNIGGDGASGRDDAGAETYPEMMMNSADVLLSLPSAKKGFKALSKASLTAVLSRCGLRTYKQLTYNVVKAIFKEALSVIIGRGVRKGDFSWSLATPPELLLNSWRMAGTSVVVDGGCFLPPDSGNASQRGAGIEKKRVALCVAAHVSPFWNEVMRQYFVRSPVNKLALPKRFRSGDDAFANANGRGARRDKLRKLSRNATAKGAGKAAGGDQAPAASGDEYQSDSCTAMPVAAISISQLALATTSIPLDKLVALDLCPLLPSSTTLSIVSLSNAEFEVVCREEGALRVVLPRELIKRAFGLLSASAQSGGALELDGRSLPDSSGGALPSGGEPAASPVLSITVGKRSPVRCSAASLAHMSSVVSLNEQIKMCSSFFSWLQALRQSTAPFPWELEFLVGGRVSVADAAAQVISACEKKRVGDSAWRYFHSSAGDGGDVAGSDLYGGCTVAYSDIILGGQTAYMTNGVLDAALVEMRLHSALRVMPAYVLLTGQSASFTTCHEKRVDEADAMRKIKEIYDVMPPARYERFLMMLNLVGQHWVSAEVLPHGKIHIFDSLDGAFEKEKDFAVARVKLFAQEIGRLRRMHDHLAPLAEKWQVTYVNAPAQADGYNCGPFALGHIWCAANGLCLGDLSYVVGDHLRLGILLTLLECGKRYEEQRLQAIAPR